jgi:hypothetical protein
VNIEEDEELPASLFQVTKVVQGEITTQREKNNKKDNRLMPRETTTQFLFPVLHPRTPSWSCVRDWCIKVNDHRGVLEDSMMCLASMCIGT